MNHLEGVRELKNNYIFLRHGGTPFNAEGRINSNPETGLISNGLLLHGIIEARFSIRRAKEQGIFANRPTVIFSSDFLRTKQTAEIAREELGEEVSVFTLKELRERDFARYDNKSAAYYQQIWNEDVAYDVTHKKDRVVESVDEVEDRMTFVIREIEKLCTGFNVLLVSHGDPLQILETTFRGINPRQHRDIEPYKTGEIRHVVFQPQAT